MSYEIDFVGRFTDKIVEDLYTNLNEDMGYVVSKLRDDEFELFEQIFYPILTNMYNNIRNKKQGDAISILDNYIIGEYNNNNEDCGICMEKIVDSENKIVKLPCTHVLHYNCIKNWVCEKKCCPLCRYDLEKKINI
jgi:hypothetical protein